MIYPRNPLLPFQCAALFLLAVFVVYLLYGCTQPPVPPGPAFEKVNGQPTESADAGPGRGESKTFGDMAVSPKFPVVYFDYDDDAIRPADRDGLVAATLGLKAEWVCYVDGHASPEGSEAYNMSLGARRASTVGDFIQSFKGISVIETSYGEEKPIPGAPSLSRRVEIRCQ